MKQQRLKFKLLALILFGMFALLAVYGGYSISTYGNRWFASNKNPRVRTQKDNVTAGNVLDTNGIILATTVDGERVYQADEAARRAIVHLLGDSQGQVSNGVETFQTSYLYGFQTSLPELILSTFRGEERRGDDVTLTVDSRLCTEIAASFAAHEKSTGKNGAAVVMNVNTGAILAMSVKGDFDPNEPFTLSSADQKKVSETADEGEKKKLQSELLNRQWRNKAVSDTYEPGSVFKAVTAAIALEENLVNKNSSFFCNGHATVAGQSYHCHKTTGHGSQTLMQAISNSCNPAFITIGQLVGVSTFSKYFKAFGFTEKTGIDLSGEASSTYHKEEKMGPVELASSSFGQSFNVTPMQFICAIAATVNGGYLVQPHMVEKILDENNKVKKTVVTSTKRQVISESTSATMRELLNFVAENGAKNALVAGYNIGAKTGTSQKLSKIQQTGDKRLYIGSCATVAPIEKPEIAILVMLDEPKGEKYYGGAISAPVNSKIMADILPYLGYEPSYTDDELKKLSITVPDTVGSTVADAKGKLTTQKLEYKVVGSGEKVVKQLPAAGSKVMTGGVVILYTEDGAASKATVPNFKGLSATEVNSAAARAGVNVEFSGNTTTGGLKAYRQSVEAGKEVDAGTVVTVYFSDDNVVDG